MLIQDYESRDISHVQAGEMFYLVLELHGNEIFVICHASLKYSEMI